MVSNAGNGNYQVLLKSGFNASLGATLKLSPDGMARLKFIAESNSSLASNSGVALTFSNREACEAFLKDFLDKNSAMHKDETGDINHKRYDPSVWLKAAQIRIVDGRSHSFDVGVGAMVTLMNQQITASKSISASATAKATYSNEVKSDIQQNAHGESVTFTRHGRLTLLAAASAGLLDSVEKELTTPKFMAKNASFVVDTVQRYKLETGLQGVLPTSSLEHEFTLGEMKFHHLRDLFLEEYADRQKPENEDFFRDLETCISKLPASAKLVVKHELKPEVLERVRHLFIHARTQDSESARTKAQTEAYELLANDKSYSPASIELKNVKPADLFKDWSPGIGAVQLVRNTSFMRQTAYKSMTIPLPK